MATQPQRLGSLAEMRPRTDNARDSQIRVLLVPAEGSTLGPISANLASAGYSVCRAHTSKDVLLNFRSARPDLILLNVSVPDTNGKQLLRQLRGWTTAPIIVISTQTDELQKIEFLDFGADDYLMAPFEMGEFLARLRAASRRAFGVPRSEVFRTGDLEVDFSKREVRVERRQVKLTATEYDLLKSLAAHAGIVRTHYQLIHEVWGGAQYQDALHLLRVTIHNLRRKLLAGSSVCCQVETEPGIGYVLRCDAHGIQVEQPQRKPQLMPEEPTQSAVSEVVKSFDRLFKYFPDAMMLLGAEGYCLSANQACQRLFLRQDDRFKSLDVDIFSRSPWELQRFRTTLERNDSVKNFEVSIRHSDDSQMKCSFTATAWRDKDSYLLGYAVMIQRQ